MTAPFVTRKHLACTAWQKYWLVLQGALRTVWRAPITRLLDPFPGLQRAGKGQVRSPEGATNEASEKSLSSKKMRSRMAATIAVLLLAVN